MYTYPFHLVYSRCLFETTFNVKSTDPVYLTYVPSQREVKSKGLFNAYGWGDCPRILTYAKSQRDFKTTRLVNALGWGDFLSISTYAPRQRDFKSTRLVSALG